MAFILSEKNTIANQYLAELRDVTIQQDRMRFRRNMERLGEIMAYEISKTFTYEKKDVETPMGIANMQLPKERIVLATILRAGLPFHQGFLNYFDNADNAFISAYRKHHKGGTFEIKIEYISCPNLDDAVLILVDPMLATGASMHMALQKLLENGTPKEIHVATAIASTSGFNYLKRLNAKASIWMGAMDDELTARSFIVPGLGDAGDLSYGGKLQE
ncbi:MAG: uracil phosphoribosyltransferase [Saprospiraceae bacterium]